MNSQGYHTFIVIWVCALIGGCHGPADKAEQTAQSEVTLQEIKDLIAGDMTRLYVADNYQLRSASAIRFVNLKKLKSITRQEINGRVAVIIGTEGTLAMSFELAISSAQSFLNRESFDLDVVIPSECDLFRIDESGVIVSKEHITARQVSVVLTK